MLSGVSVIPSGVGVILSGVGVILSGVGVILQSRGMTSKDLVAPAARTTNCCEDLAKLGSSQPPLDDGR
jgi:hypothetical protein